MKKTRTRTYLIDGIIVDVTRAPRFTKLHLLPPPGSRGGWRETVLILRPTTPVRPVPRPTKKEIERIVRREKNRRRP